MNPFSDGPQAPKLMDGQAAKSHGLRLSKTFELDLLTGATSHMILYPGHKNICVYTTQSLLGTNNFEAQLSRVEISPFYNGGYTLDTDSNTWPLMTPVSDEELAAWRTVSCGARFALLNNNDENEGWFEAIRYVPKFDRTLHGIYQDPVASDDGVGHWIPGPGDWLNLSNADMPMDSTYTCDTLRNLGKYIFQTKDVQKSHPFVPVAPLSIATTTTYTAWNTDADTAGRIGKQFGSNTSSTASMQTVDDFSNCWDTSQDLIYIRFHGRTQGSGSVSKLLVHLANNLEVMYTPQSVYSALESQSDEVDMKDVRDAKGTANANAGHNPYH